MESHLGRVVVLVDMDCFYCQVEENLNPELKGKPIAVVQYNAWRGGGLIAVNYPARDNGVTRHMRGDEAKEKCPDIELVRVPTVRGKADLTKYREAGKRVADVLKTYTPLLQRASIDEAYLDITEAVKNRLSNIKENIRIENVSHTYVVDCSTEDFIKNVYSNDFNHDQNLRLLIGGVIVEEIRQAVYERTGYRCSAGIAHNKILAKLVCGMNKPNKQTILPHDRVESLYKTLPIKKIKSLGGKFGHTLSEDLNIKFMSELTQFSEKELMRKYDEKTASWLFNIARGIDTEPVETRLISKSIGCCKRFPGKTALLTLEDVKHWLSELSEEIAERLEQDLEENNRKAKQIVVSFAQEINKKDVHSSRTQALNSYDPKRILEDTLENLRKFTERPDGSFCIKFLGLSAGKFEGVKKVNDISTFFKQVDKNGNKKLLEGDKKEFIRNESKENEMVKEKMKKKNFLINFLSNQGVKNSPHEGKEEKVEEKWEEGGENDENEEGRVNTEEEKDENELLEGDMQEIINESRNGSNSLENKFLSASNHKLELSIIDIEKDADESFDFIEGQKENDCDSFLSASTTEMEYTELLKNSKEYPNKIIENDSKQNEISVRSNNSSPIIEHNSNNANSFIVRYFKQFATASTSLQNTERCVSVTSDKNSVINQNSDDSDFSNSNQYKNTSTGDKENLDLIQVYESDSEKESTECEESTQCEECKERIPISQLILHMDEHMALKLMEEEKKYFQQELENIKQKKLNEATKNNKSPTKKSSTTKSLKRKLPHDNGPSISSFFQSKPESSNNSEKEPCPECGKQINSSEFSSHLDFHAAKKLHLELNPVKISYTNQFTKNNSKTSNKKLKNNTTNSQTLSNFFKKI